ncbi:MAG: choice-of-anchor M domain-containing protein [Planctomycetales bacterium]|nr:choice-of-anchor M domain-containing protein [Planctomycetales bacterium]
MRFLVFVLTLHLLNSVADFSRAAIYISGHSDLGVGFEDDNLHLHLHAEQPLGLFGGGTVPAGEYDPGDLLIGVPNPMIGRPVGAQWDFLAANAGASVWFLPQSSDPNKPFLGLGTEELLPEDGWSTLTWTFNSITTISGDNSDFALWQNDSFGNPSVLASTLVPTGAGNTWTQNALSHDHYNFGFTGEGVYDVSLSISGNNSGAGTIAPGPYFDTASFRFVTGNAIAVPEPNSLAALGLAAIGGTLFRRRRLA